MSNQEETLEKLIGDVGESICAWFYWGKHEPEDAVRCCSREVIVRIGKAYVDREIKLPGEVGRGEMNVADLALHIASCKRLEVEGNIVNIIALRPKEEGLDK